ncbi:TPA_asm: hypothetical protein GYS69_14340 [Listeria monocytogenes]|nr:hypothetical protein [Listeria monocytogenes]
MENEKQKIDYVSRAELFKHGNDIKKEMSSKVDKVESKVDKISEEVVELKVLVIPMVTSAKETAKNTQKMADTLERYTRSTTKQLHEHDLEIAHVKNSIDNTLKNIADDESEIKEKRFSNVQIITSVLALVGIILGGILSWDWGQFIFK